MVSLIFLIILLDSSPHCSRPTAVNLSDAAIKLKKVVHKAALTSTDAGAIFEVIIVI